MRWSPREKNKASIFKRCFQEIHGIYYKETFENVVSFITLQTFLSMIAIKTLQLHKNGRNKAITHGDLKENIFKEQPQSLIDKNLSGTSL